jgi:hypothetical protein
MRLVHTEEIGKMVAVSEIPTSSLQPRSRCQLQFWQGCQQGQRSMLHQPSGRAGRLRPQSGPRVAGILTVQMMLDPH